MLQPLQLQFKCEKNEAFSVETKQASVYLNWFTSDGRMIVVQGMLGLTTPTLYQVTESSKED